MASITRSRTLSDVLTERGLARNKLDIQCPASVCSSIAMKLDNWQLLAPFLGVAEEDCSEIKEDNRNFAVQRSKLLTTWRRQYGHKATFLKLAEGLEKIKRLDLIEYLCELFMEEQVELPAIGSKGDITLPFLHSLT